MIVGFKKGRNLSLFKRGLFANCQRFAIWMLIVSSSYLLLSLGLKYHAQDKAEQTLAAAGIDNIVRIKTMPVLPTILMWRTLAEDNQHHLIELRGSVLDNRLPEYRYLTQYKDSKALNASLPQSSQPYASRLDWFSGDWTGYRTQKPNGDSNQDSAQNNEQTTQLVVDDLRMMAGDTAFFSFVLAIKNNDNLQWQGIAPTDAPVITIDNKPEPSRFKLIKQGFKRVFDESVIDENGSWKLVD